MMNWSSRPGGDDEATVKITAIRKEGNVLWNIASHMLSEEEILDFVYYVKEATNAYTIEITWALVLVLGGTCLYIYRLLGQQEAARIHLRRANCRPVFSSKTVVNSPFLLAYKNRFANKDTKKQAEEVNAVGYDVLHRYSKSTFDNCLIPKAVWKRHSSGQELESTDLQHQRGDRSWDAEVTTIKNRSYSMPKRPIQQSQQPGLYHLLSASRNTVVPHQPRLRSVPLEVKNSKYQQLQRNTNQQELKMVADQIKHHSPQPVRPPRKLSASPPPPPPIPAPRSEEKLINTTGLCVSKEKGPVAKPRKKSLSPDQKNRPDPASRKLSKGKAVTGGRKKTKKYVECSSDSETSSDSSSKISRPKEVMHTKQRKSATKQTKPDIKQMIKCAKRIPKKTDLNSAEGENVKNIKCTNAIPENKNLKPDLLETATNDSLVESLSTSSDIPQHLAILRSHAELKMLDRLRKKLLSKGNILERYQTASAFLDKVSQLYTESRLHQLHKATDTDSKPHLIDSTEMCSDQSYKTHVDNSVSGGKYESTTTFSLPVSDKAPNDDIKKYHSPALRAVQSEEKSMQDEIDAELLKQHHIQIYADKLAKGSNETAPKMAGSMDDSGNEDSISECERRLAYLRMRMKSTLGKTPSPPNPEKMIVNKRWSAMDDQVSKKGEIEEHNRHTEADMFTSRHAKKEMDVYNKKNIPPKSLITADHSFKRPEVEKLNLIRALVTASNPTNNAMFTEAERATSFLEIADSSRRHSKTVVTMPSDNLSTQECKKVMSATQENTLTAEESVSQRDKSCSKAASSEERVLAWKETLLDEESREEILECQKTKQEDFKITQSSCSNSNEFNTTKITVKLSMTDLLKSLENIIHFKTDPSKSVNDTPASVPKSDEVKAEHQTVIVKEPHDTIHLVENESKPNKVDVSINNAPQISPKEIQKIIFSGYSVNAIKSPMPYTSIDGPSGEKSIVTHKSQLVEADKLIQNLEWDSSAPRTPQVSPVAAYLKAMSVATGADPTQQILPGEPTELGISKSDKPWLKKPIENNVKKAYNAQQQKALPKVKAFNVVINNKKMSLAGGETGLAKQVIKVRSDTGICEESTLTPSMASQIFDPKMQRARELEKQEVERIARTTNIHRQGVSSNQFRASISLFERPDETTCNQNVKACVQMYENRSVSLSPERRRRYTVRLSGSPPTPKFSLP